MREKIDSHEAIDFCSDAEVCNVDEVRALESHATKLEARLEEAVELIKSAGSVMFRVGGPDPKEISDWYCKEQDFLAKINKEKDE